MKRIGHVIISLSSWLVAPFLIGLVFGLAALAYTFVLRLADFFTIVGRATEEQVIVGILKLIDLSLTANLLVIVIAASYMNYVSRMDSPQESNLPPGLIGIGFSALKLKLLGSIIAIAAVKVLEWFMDIERSVDNTKLIWVVGILLAFSLATLLLAIADSFAAKQHK